MSSKKLIRVTFLKNYIFKKRTQISSLKKRLRNKKQIAFGDTESKEQRIRRMQRVRKIAFFATTSFLVGAALWSFPRTRKIILSSALRLKSRFSEIFYSTSSEPKTVDTIIEKLDKTNTQILIPIAIGCLIGVALGFGVASMPISVGNSKAIEEELKNPTSKETGGVGPSEWPEWLRVVIHEVIFITAVAIPSYLGLVSSYPTDGGVSSNSTNSNVTHSSITP